MELLQLKEELRKKYGNAAALHYTQEFTLNRWNSN